MRALSDPPLILVVDDSDEVREATLRLLRIAGYRAVGAADGGEALRMAHAVRPAAIVTDLVMPVVTGVELAERLAQAPLLKHIPVIAFSASTDLIPNAPGLFRAVLCKPFASAQLLIVIADTLSGPP